MNFTKISWQKLEKDCMVLAQKIGDIKIDEIVSISRGGMVVSRLLSDLLDLPISHIAIESYLDLQQQKEPIVTQVSSREFKGESILLVDELSDSGKTFLRGLSYLKELPISNVYTAAPYYKSHTVYIPDFSVEKIDGWIILPYEIKETQDAIRKEIKDSKDAKKKILSAGFEEWEIIS